VLRDSLFNTLSIIIIAIMVIKTCLGYIFIITCYFFILELMYCKIGTSYSAVAIAVMLLLFASGPGVVDHKAYAYSFFHHVYGFYHHPWWHHFWWHPWWHLHW